MEFQNSSMWCNISDLHPTKMKSKAAIKLRFVRVYEITSAKNKNQVVSLEAITHDTECDRISVTIPQVFIKQWKATLKEGFLYGIKFFTVMHNYGKYKISTHEYKIKFNFETDVKKMVDDKFPKQIFLFKPYEEIQNLEVIKDGELFDVIGILLNKPMPQIINTISGVQKRLMDLILQDTEGKRMTCTLWDDYIDEFLQLLKNYEQPSNIIILQLGKPNMYQGRMKMQSAFFVSKVLVNADIEEVHDFKEKVIIASDLCTTVIGTGYEKSSSCISNDERKVVDDLKTIDELLRTNEIGVYWIVGKVVSVNLEDGWFYISCKLCNKKLSKQGHNFYCSKCNKTDISGNMRYKLAIDVVDETYGATLVLWERECIQIIGKSVADLVEKEDVHNLPVDIYNALMGKKFMFKIPIKPRGENDYNGSFSVMQVNCDLTYINSYNHSTSTVEEPFSEAKVEQKKGSNEDFKEIIQIETPTSKLDIEMVREDEQVKRSLADEFSATLPKKKSKVIVKKEKI